VGDDSGVALYRDVISALATLGKHDCEVIVMLGNRDFLLGEEFAKATGATLIRDDELIINIDGEPVLLMHGDTLCIDDTEYQRFRQQVRDPQWQQSFLAKPVDQRIAYANQLRDQSRELSSSKSADIMDVNVDAVRSRLAAHQCHTLIHGHTHKPSVHLEEIPQSKRFVVGDWHATHAQFVLKDNAGFHLQTFKDVEDNESLRANAQSTD